MLRLRSLGSAAETSCWSLNLWLFIIEVEVEDDSAYMASWAGAQSVMGKTRRGCAAAIVVDSECVDEREGKTEMRSQKDQNGRLRQRIRTSSKGTQTPRSDSHHSVSTRSGGGMLMAIVQKRFIFCPPKVFPLGSSESRIALGGLTRAQAWAGPKVRRDGWAGRG